MFARLKHLLPNHPVPLRVLWGPFRGARVVMNPRYSLRKVFGLYEHELNGWLQQALPRVTRVLDVGANDGYFAFGCAAAFTRFGVKGEVTCFEPQSRHVEVLREGIAAQASPDVRFEIVPAFAGREVSNGVTTLDAIPLNARRNTLIKIDVEGAELDVIEGARSWMGASNLFVIEVHQERYLDELHRTFRGQGLSLVQVNQRPLFLLGREDRDQANWWLVSDLGTNGRAATVR